MAGTALEIVQYVCAGVGAGAAAWFGARAKASATSTKASVDTAVAALQESFTAHAERVESRLDDTVERVARLERRLSPSGVPRVRAPSEPG